MRKCLVVLTFIAWFAFNLCFRCGHDKHLKEKGKTMQVLDLDQQNTRIIEKDSSSRNLDQVSWEALEIFIDYTTLTKQKSQQPSLASENYIKNVTSNLNEVKGLFGKLLKSHSKANYKFNLTQVENCSQEIKEIDSTIEKGSSSTVNLHLVIIPILQTPEKLGQNVDASAFTCMTGLNNKPVLGIVYLGTNYNFEKTNSDEYFQLLLMHEITHVLGFSQNFFKLFPGGETNVIKRTINGVERSFLATPKVKEIAKKYFGCDSLPGVELEDQGGSGSQGSHWESRVMWGDYMVSTDYPEIVISEISLALLEDSGFYQPNYFTGGLFRFGKHKGCSFLCQRCIQQETANFKEFCDVSGQKGCLGSGLDRGVCYLSSNLSNIPQEYQYFSNPTKGGFQPADYCPVYYANPVNNYYFPTSCAYGVSESGSTIGNSSICINTSLNSSSTQALCHVVECDTNNAKVKIKLSENNVIDCPTNGALMSLAGYSGIIECPKYSDVCTGSTFCNNAIDCINNSSQYNVATFSAASKIDDTVFEETEAIIVAKKSSNMLKIQVMYIIVIWLFMLS